jgi:hypothetical protein
MRDRFATIACSVWFALLIAGSPGLPGSAQASEGSLVEVVQPMFLSGSTAFVLHAVTYVEDSESAWPGREIEFVGRSNAVGADRVDPVTGRPAAINTNVANLLGIVLRVRRDNDVNKAKRASDGMLHVDTVAVEIDLTRAEDRVAAGMMLGGERLGAQGLERALQATSAAALVNARASWPRMRYLSIQVRRKKGLDRSAEVVAVEPLPLPRLY